MGNQHVAKPRAGGFDLEYQPGRGWFVIDPNGVRKAGPFQCDNKALMSLEARQRAADQAAKRMLRPCMCCQREFYSEGIHNRLCGPCRLKSDGGSLSIGGTSTGKVRRAARTAG